MAPDAPLAELLADARDRGPDPPSLDEVVEDAGRQRLAAFYLYSALVAGVIGADDLAPGRWPHELTESIQRLNLSRFAPRTRRGLDAQLTPAEQAMWRSPDRQVKFGELLVDLISQGAFGPLCGDADRVRLVRADDGRELNLELIQARRVAGTCAVKDHWELVAQYLAGMPLHGRLAKAASTPGSLQTVAHQLQETGIAHAVGKGVTLAVGIYPLGAAADLGTRLVRARIQAGRNEADALGGLGQEVGTLRAEADRELGDLRPPGRGNWRLRTRRGLEAQPAVAGQPDRDPGSASGHHYDRHELGIIPWPQAVPSRRVLRLAPEADPGVMVVRVQRVNAEAEERQHVGRVARPARVRQLAVAGRVRLPDDRVAAAGTEIAVALTNQPYNGQAHGTRAAAVPRPQR
jgi:hypothetical protein